MDDLTKDLDLAIDRAVRDVMSVDTDAGFRARVTARLDEPARRALSHRWVAVVAGLGAAVLALVVTLDRRAPESAPAGAQIAESGPAAAPGAAPEVRLPAPAAAPQVVRPAPSPARARRADRMSVGDRGSQRIAAASITDTSADASPADQIPPIVIEPLAGTPIEPEPIVVPALSPIPQVQVEPLFPRTERK